MSLVIFIKCRITVSRFASGGVLKLYLGNATDKAKCFLAFCNAKIKKNPRPRGP